MFEHLGSFVVLSPVGLTNRFFSLQAAKSIQFLDGPVKFVSHDTTLFTSHTSHTNTHTHTHTHVVNFYSVDVRYGELCVGTCHGPAARK